MQQHTTPIDIRFADIDALGHVNNAKYFTYFEQARIKFLDDLFGDTIRYEVNGVIVASAHADFKIPVLFKDKIFVRTWCSRLGKKSFDISYSLFKNNDGKEVEMATGLTAMVCFDYTKGASMEMPDLWRKTLERNM